MDAAAQEGVASSAPHPRPAGSYLRRNPSLYICCHLPLRRVEDVINRQRSGTEQQGGVRF
jgi:hypothetical protein